MWLEAVSQSHHAEKCPTCGGGVRRRAHGEMHAGSYVSGDKRVEIRKRPRAGFADPIYLDPLTTYFDGGLYSRWPSERYWSRGGTKLHRDVWQAAFGPIPRGCHIHHRDGNPDNNCIANLECVPASEHLSRTWRNGPKSKYQPGQHFSETARQRAAEWHRSDEGRLGTSAMPSGQRVGRSGSASRGNVQAAAGPLTHSSERVATRKSIADRLARLLRIATGSAFGPRTIASARRRLSGGGQDVPRGLDRAAAGRAHRRSGANEAIGGNQKMPFEFKTVLEHGSSNPIVARLSLQILEILKHCNAAKDIQDKISDLYMNSLLKKLMRCWEIEERFKKEFAAAAGNYKPPATANAPVVVPQIARLEEECHNFLYEARNFIRDLLKVVNQLYGTAFQEASEFSWPRKVAGL
jgi:HNH endonuclease